MKESYKKVMVLSTLVKLFIFPLKWLTRPRSMRRISQLKKWNYSKAVRSDAHEPLVYWITHVQTIISLLFKGLATIGSFVVWKKYFWVGMEF
jgi:hypothetical protein